MKQTISITVGPGRGFVRRRDEPNLLVAQRFRATFEFPDDHTVELEVQMTNDGLPELCELVFKRNPACPKISGADLRRLPLANWIATAVAEASFKFEQTKGGGRITPTAAPPLRRSRSQRNEMTPGLLAEVAREWRSGENKQGTARVRDRWHLSTRTASRWVTLARKAGFLEEDER